MSSLIDCVRRNQDELRDGIAWVIFWRSGRSWGTDYIYLEDDDAIDPDDLARLQDIVAVYPDAVILNGYYCGHLAEDMSVPELARGVRWHHDNQCNQLCSYAPYVNAIEH